MKKKILFSLLFALVFLAIIQLNSNASSIPRVDIEGDLSNMQTKSDVRKVKITYTSDEVNFESYTEIKIQGHTSLSFEKKNYTIKLFKDSECTEKNKVEVNKDWGKQSKYCLKANWVDDVTQARNIVPARISAKVQARYNVFTNTPHNGTIDGFPIEIYNNDEFLGIYTWNIPKDDWLWSIDSKDEKQYTIEAEQHSKATAFKENITEFNEDVFDVEAGTKSEAALKHIQDTIAFVKDSSDEEFRKKFGEYFDLDSTLDYIVCCFYFGAVDNLDKNMLLVTYDGKKFYPSMYDLDTTYGTHFDGTEKDPYDTRYDNEDSLLWNRFINIFSNEVAQRWFDLRKDIFTKEATMKEFRDFYNSIPEESWQKEKARWGEDRLPGFGLNQIEEFLDFRIKFVDNIMDSKYTPEYKEKQKQQELKVKIDKDIENFNKLLMPMLAIITGIIVILIIIEMVLRMKKRK